MNEKLKNYYDQWGKPWTDLYYRMVWTQLGELKDKKILDFGSGFGWNANHFAKDNEVLALEPNEEMVENRAQDNEYQQVTGGLNELKALPDHSFDLILCHNVLEYAFDERKAILMEFDRLISKTGKISIVKHNHAGAIMQKVIFQNALDEAYEILKGGNKYQQAFGQIHYYELPELIEGLSVQPVKTYGVRTFWALQPNEVKTAPDWQEKMFKVEQEVMDQPDYQAISFFNHILLRRRDD